MADKDDAKDKKKKKSIIASLDLKNYKAKYTDSYGLGKPNEVDLDNFLVAEPDKNAKPEKPAEKIVEKKAPPINPAIVEPIKEKPVEIKKSPEPVVEKPTEPVIETNLRDESIQWLKMISMMKNLCKKPLELLDRMQSKRPGLLTI